MGSGAFVVFLCGMACAWDGRMEGRAGGLDRARSRGGDRLRFILLSMLSTMYCAVCKSSVWSAIATISSSIT